MSQEVEPIPFIEPMLHWWRLMLRSLVVLAVVAAVVVLHAIYPLQRFGTAWVIAGNVAFWILAAAGVAFWLLCVVMTFVYMHEAALAAADNNYAVSHVVLAIALTPVLMLGPILVPLLVRADIQAWRRHDAAHSKHP